MGNSKFTGSLLGLIGTNILAGFIVLISFGVLIPWAVCIRQSWYAKHTYIEGKQLYFEGNAVELFGQYIKWFLLTLITLGIYGFWLNIKMKSWVVSKTRFA